MFAARGFRLASLCACLVMAMTVISVDQAEARRGGSFGSRGTRTFQTAPATPTSPGVTAPVNRTMTPAQNAAPTAASAQAAQRGMFGGMGGSLLRGLMFGGLLGLLFGGGFGGFAGFLGLIGQALLIGLVIFFAMRLFGNRAAQPAGAGMARGAGPGLGGMGLGGLGGGARSGSAKPRTRDEVGIEGRDFDRFEAMLGEVQAAYGAEDYATLRRLTTPEMMGFLAEELGDNASRGLRNEVSQVKLLQGDLSEGWREGQRDYATVAMRYEALDVTRERDSGRVVEGDPSGPTQATELWTFLRDRGGPWTLSAIQSR